MPSTPEPPPYGPDGLPVLSGSGKTPEQLWRYVLRQLGSRITEVELTGPGDKDPVTHEPIPEGETDYDDCMEDSKRWFSYRVGMKKIISVHLANRQGVYLMPPDCMDVIDVWLPSYQLPSLDADQFSYTYFSMLFGQWTNPNVAPLPYSDLVQRLQYLEQVGRIFSSDRDWEYRPETRTLEILPPPAAIGGITGVPYGMDVRALVTIWSSNIDIRQLDPTELDLFKRKLLTRAKIALGNRRSKYDSMSSVGGDHQMNGQALLDQAAKEEEQLEKDVVNWRRSVPIIFG